MVGLGEEGGGGWTEPKDKMLKDKMDTVKKCHLKHFEIKIEISRSNHPSKSSAAFELIEISNR